MTQKSELLTERYRLAPISPNKVSSNWIRWMSNPVLTSQLNVKAVKLTRDGLQRHVVDTWKSGQMIIGIYARANGDHIGLYTVSVDHRNRNVTLDAMIGQQRYDLASVLSQTDPVLLDFLVQEHRVERAAAVVVETNLSFIGHLEATGWQKEGVLRQEYQAISGGRRLDAVHFGRLLDGNISVKPV
jgi:hypothetical protein